MRRPNRNVEIFSMSALDLFASGLGAFIVIAIVLLPYFPNEGDSSVRVADVQAKLDAALARIAAYEATADDKDRMIDALKAESAQQKARIAALESEVGGLRAEIAEMQKGIAEAKLPDLDLVLALDVTGSMGQQIDGLKQETDGLVGVLTKLAPSLGVGIVAFGDRAWDAPLTLHKLAEVRPDSAAHRDLQRFVAGLSINMGQGGGKNPEDPEALDQALAAAVAMPWRGVATRRIVVVITDNPPYPEAEARTLDIAARFGAQAGAKVSAVYVNTGSNSQAGAADYLRRLAQAGGGEYVRSGGSITATLLTALLD